MVDIIKIDPKNKDHVNQFIKLPFTIYQDCPQWVPPFVVDVKSMLNKNKHPFHKHSDTDFFIAVKNGETVGRVVAMENKPYNRVHDTTSAFFSLYESFDDQEIANALFERIFDWAHQRGLNKVMGTKGFGAFDGYGFLISGFEHRQMMTMMKYNFPYYQKQMESLGFEKEVDFISCCVTKDKFAIPEKAREIARRIRERGTFKIISFRTKRELKAWASEIGELYNTTFVNNWEYYPLSKKEVDYTLNDVLMIADPKLIKLITYKDKVAGFLLGFRDISASMQRNGGRITPWGIVDMLFESRRAGGLTFNGTGVIPELQGRGGNALMYDEMFNTVMNNNIDYIDMPQIAETAVQMRKDLKTLGGTEYKNHRIYKKEI